MKRFLTTAAAIVTLAALVGCNGPARFPFGASYDKHEFLSTPSQPLSVHLIDTLSGETLWMLDVPVGQKGVVDLGTGATMLMGNKPEHSREIRWGVYEPGDSTFHELLPERMALSGNPVMLKLTVRDPEPYPANASRYTTRVPTRKSSIPGNSQPAPLPVPEPVPTPPAVKRNFSGLRASDK